LQKFFIVTAQDNSLFSQIGVGGNAVTKELDIQALYKRCVRKAGQLLQGQKYQAKAVDVELNLAETKEPEQ
jgi:hypothetical protein